MRGPILGTFCLLCAFGHAIPQYKYETMMVVPPNQGGSGSFIRDFEASGKVVYGPIDGPYRLWDGAKLYTNLKLRDLDVNSAGELTYGGTYFRRSITGPDEKVPQNNGYDGNIYGITNRGEVYGSYPFGGGIQGEFPFIYNIRTGVLTFPPKPATHRWESGMIVKMDDHGRYVIAGYNPPFNEPIRQIQGATFVDGDRVMKIPLDNDITVMMNGVGAVISARDPVLPTYSKNGAFKSLDWNPGYSFSNDDIIPVQFAPGIPTLELWQIDGKSYKQYKIHDVTPSLPSDFKVYHAHIRPDGAMAAMAERNGQYYLLKFTPVPEPTTMLALGVGAMAMLRRSRKSPQRPH